MSRIRKPSAANADRSASEQKIAGRSLFIGSRCPSCSSPNIQRRDVAIAAGTSGATWLGVTSGGEIAVGLGRSRSELARQADFESEDVGFAEIFISIFVGAIFGALGWVVGVVFDFIFGTEIVIFFTLIPFGIACTGVFIILLLAKFSSSREDGAKGWICLSCGAKFASAETGLSH